MEPERVRNLVASAIIDACGYLPLSVRYQAADAAIKIATDWQRAFEMAEGRDDS